MTIVTKPLSEKKSDSNQEPLVDGIKIDITEPDKGVPLTYTRPAGRPTPFRALVREKRVNTASTACLFLTALIVMSCGVTIGLYLYSQFGQFMRAQVTIMHKLSCRIPYHVGPAQSESFTMYKLGTKEPYFHEDFEIANSHEKINVPDFSGGRHSRFIHDFKLNKTGIVDVEGRKCFVMPLNHSTVLPPHTLFDLLKKMQEGYYEVDTAVLRDTMRVVLPAIEDRSSVGQHIQRECLNYPIYKLERYTSEDRVFKRSAEPEVLFAEFAGKNTHELHIINYKDTIDEHELQTPLAMS